MMRLSPIDGWNRRIPLLSVAAVFAISLGVGGVSSLMEDEPEGARTTKPVRSISQQAEFRTEIVGETATTQSFDVTIELLIPNSTLYFDVLPPPGVSLLSGPSSFNQTISDSVLVSFTFGAPDEQRYTVRFSGDVTNPDGFIEPVEEQLLIDLGAPNPPVLPGIPLPDDQGDSTLVYVD